MRIKKKSTKQQPVVSTASLPDIVFILLFFFMAVAIMKTKDPIVTYEIPVASKLYRFEDPSLLANIRIGQFNESNSYSIQLGDAIHSINEIPAYIKGIIDRTPTAEVEKLIAYLEIDKKTKMVLVNQVKQKLKEAKLFQLALAGEER